MLTLCPPTATYPPLGTRKQVGVAKNARVTAVRILDCDGTGTISDTIAGDYL